MSVRVRDVTSTALGTVWGAESASENAEAYDAWAPAYERDLFAVGYRLPAMLAVVVARHLSPESGPILDAGCGSGAQAEPLAMLGYGPLVGIDLSEGMLDAARAKGIYAELHLTGLGPTVDVPGEGAFAGAICCGALTPGHAPPDGMDGLLAAVRPGGLVAMTLRDDADMDPAYAARADALVADGRWRRAFTSPPFRGMPYGEPGITHRVHAFWVL